MGKGTIIGGGTDGRYVVAANLARARLDAELAIIEVRINALADDIEAAEDAVEAAREELATHGELVDGLVQAWATERRAQADAGETVSGDMPDELTAGVERLAELREKVAEAVLNLTRLQAEDVSLKTRRKVLQDIPPDAELSAWCADLTEDLTGEVRTIEVPGEGAQHLLIAPGDPDRAAPSAAAGRLHARAGMSPVQAYFNAAILPGWQRFKPTHRFAQITSIDYAAETASILLEDAFSSAQDLPINQATRIANVPIRYMTCNAAAFVVDDDVLVQFEDQDWAKPVIIGFRNNPRSCNSGGFILAPADGSYDVAAEPTVRTWPDVFYQVAAYGGSAVYRKRNPYTHSPATSLRLTTRLESMPVNWVGRRVVEGAVYESVVTWDHGLPTRYRLYPSQDCSGRVVRIDEAGFPEFANSGRPGVCLNGERISTEYVSDDDVRTVFNVVGAAVFKDMLVAVTHTDFSWRPDPEQSETENAISRAAANSTTLTVLYRSDAIWKIAGFEKFAPPMFLRAPWFFSPDGSKAITVLSVSTVLQYKLGVDLTATDGVVSASFSRSTLSCEAPYLDTLGDPIVLNPYTPAQWLAPGPWSYCGYGLEGSTIVDSLLDAPYGAYSSWASQFAQQKFDTFPNEPKIMYGFGSESARFYDIGWQYGSTGTIGTSLPARNDWWAYYDTPGPSASFQIFLVTFNAYRDTFYRGASTGTQSRFARNFTGKQYIAADFSSSGAERILTLEAADDDPYCLLGSDDYSQRSELRPSRVVTEWYNVTERKRTRDVAIAGTTAWVLKCDGVEWLRVSGGVDGRYDRNRTHIQTTVFPAVGSYREFAVEYSHSPAKLFVERGWLIDADIRSESYIFERRRREITPDDPIDTGTEVGTAGVMEVFSGQQITRDSLTVVVNGETVSHIDFPETVNTSPTIFAAAATMQLLPRWYDLEESVEETLVQTMLWTIGSVIVPISRVWLLSLYDPHPKALRKGQLQLRLGDWAVSTSDETTRREFLGPLADPPVIYRRPATYVSAIDAGGVRFDIAATAGSALAESDPPPGDDVRVMPIRVA